MQAGTFRNSMAQNKFFEVEMKKVLLSFCCVAAVVLLAANTYSQAIDMIMDGTLDDNSASADKSNTETPAEDLSNSESDSEGGSILEYIKKPLSFLFSADDEVVSEDGKKETFLEKSVRMAGEGSLTDQMNLGYMYLYGTNGVEQNYDKAFYYYELAANQKDPIALNNLGSFYFNGIGTKRDIAKATEYFKKAAELGEDNAATNLAFIYLTGGHKDLARSTQAVKLFDFAAEKGNNIAKFMLGYAYLKGFTVQKDYYKAFSLIKAAADKGSLLDEAQLTLGYMYVHGYGTVQNYANGITYFKAAMNQGNTDAYSLLADTYLEGRLVPQNVIMAHALLNLAAAEGIDGAAEKRDKIGAKMKLEMLMQAQNMANEFKPHPSPLTLYVQQTYGYNIRSYINNNMIVDEKDEIKKVPVPVTPKKSRGASLL